MDSITFLQGSGKQRRDSCHSVLCGKKKRRKKRSQSQHGILNGNLSEDVAQGGQFHELIVCAPELWMVETMDTNVTVPFWTLSYFWSLETCSIIV